MPLRRTKFSEEDTLSVLGMTSPENIGLAVDYGPHSLLTVDDFLYRLLLVKVEGVSD
jgi:hypothetical protein